MKKLTKKQYLAAAFDNWEDSCLPYDTGTIAAFNLYCHALDRVMDPSENIFDMSYVDHCSVAAQVGCELAGLC